MEAGEFYAVAEARGWTDGLPVIPPIEERIVAMLATGNFPSEETLGWMPPVYGEITYARIAANAVMAGCKPAFFPVVATAVLAMMESPFNLNSVQATTHPVAPLVVVHGPIAAELGMNGGTGAFGPGNRANATIGRAVRLCMMNIGGAQPYGFDRSTYGMPSKYTFCITENIDDNPWAPFHVDCAGFAPDRSAVTVAGVENPHNVNDSENAAPENLLFAFESALENLGSNHNGLTKGQIAVILCPEHANTLARASWTRRHVQEYLFEHARCRIADLRRAGLWTSRVYADWMVEMENDDEARVPPVRAPEDYLVFVVGGSGPHSSVLPAFGLSRSVTRALIS